jgi:membrane-associated phospholipid phosphatase
MGQPLIALDGRLRHGLTFVARNSPDLYAAGFLVAWALTPSRDPRRVALLRSVAAGAIGVAAARSLGALFYRDRPFVRDAEPAPLVAHAPSSSFPSTHAAGATGFLLGIAGGPRWLHVAFALLTPPVLAARVLARLHDPGDVVGGVVIGWLASRCARALPEGLLRRAAAIG